MKRFFNYIKELINGGFFAFTFISMLAEIETWEYGIWFQLAGTIASIFGYVLIMIFVFIPHGLVFSVVDNVKETKEGFEDMKDKTGRYGALGIVIIAFITGIGSISEFLSGVNYIMQSAFFTLAVIALSFCISIARQKQVVMSKLKPSNIKQGIVLVIGVLGLSITSILFGLLSEANPGIGFASIWLILVCVEAIIIANRFNAYETKGS